MRLSLGDVLAHAPLGLDLRVGGPAALERSVAGAHVIEIEHPTRWVPPDWIMLSTGLRLQGRPAEQRRLIAELHEHGQAALGFGVGLVEDDIPPAILEEAARRGLPVLSVPVATPFRDVIAFVNGAWFSDDLFVVRRTLAVQSYVMDALGAEDPVAAIVGRLA